MGQDNASNGLSVAQQWEVLYPGAANPATRALGAPPPAAPRVAPGNPAGAFAAGQVIEAKYGRQWVRGRITRVWPTQGPSGPQITYDVLLENGQRGILPSRMLRPVGDR